VETDRGDDDDRKKMEVDTRLHEEEEVDGDAKGGFCLSSKR
jgi:hypothetical protein